jgi:TusA-related sulfurtransferase
MKRIDARGLSCPEPVIMIRQAMASKEAAYEMVVDNVASRENVTRYAEHQGYKVEVKEADGEYTLKMTR